MCGIAGFLNRPLRWKEDIIRMNRRMAHRGPDAQGYWSDEEHTAVLGHVRLSILDLSDAGSQPMISQNGQYVMVMNGEIYNYRSLRKRLLVEKKVREFRGHSDTEVLLAYMEAYGFEEALKDSIGMFAVGVYDRQNRILRLGRDRIGEKPLYYGFAGKSFVFASEIGCIYELAGKDLEIFRDVLNLYFLHGYIPAPYTIYRGIYKLDAGSIIEIPAPFTEFRIHKYWDIMKAAENGISHRFQGTEDDAADELERILKQAVKRQMAADVPVGAFLSGGIDSTAVVAVMQSLSMDKVKTFSIGFEESSYNEAEEAKRTAEYLGTDHTSLYVTPRDITEVIPKLPYIYGEPFADSSQIPSYLVSRLAREKVSVSLSGDAGDELFCGYGSYTFVQNSWNKIKHIPFPLRKIACCVLNESWLAHNKYLSIVSHLLDVKCPEELYLRIFDARIDLSGFVLDSHIPVYKYLEYPYGFLGKGGIENVMLMDMLVYHPDDILVKVDRSAMAVSLETRIPLLDKDIVEFALSLPHKYKQDGTVGKKVLRNVLYRYVPKEMMERPKKGFSIPVEQWIRNGQLLEWAEDMLETGRIRRQGILNPDMTENIWNEFKKSGKNGRNVWYILMFQEWMQKMGMAG